MTGIDMIAYPINYIIVGVIPAEIELSAIFNYYIGKADALEKWKHRGLEITDDILKITGIVLE